jgi:hypothetical protein
MEPAKIACKYGVNWRRGWRGEFHQMTIPGRFCNLRDGFATVSPVYFQTLHDFACESRTVEMAPIL